VLFVRGVQLRSIEVNNSDFNLVTAHIIAALLSSVCQQLKKRLTLVSLLVWRKTLLTVTTDTKEDAFP
jgi:hypothetical protein